MFFFSYRNGTQFGFCNHLVFTRIWDESMYRITQGGKKAVNIKINKKGERFIWIFLLKHTL